MVNRLVGGYRYCGLSLCFPTIRCDMMKGEVRRSFKFNDLLLAVILHCDAFSIRVELLCVVL